MKQKISIALTSLLLLIVITIIHSSCAKEQINNTVPDSTAVNKDTVYTSIADFYSKNGVVSKNYTVNADSGGSFTTSKGTIVTIPANAFTDKNGNVVHGNVNIEFKDIYSKSDMLLSDKPTISSWGSPLKSGGEFFIKATSGNVAVNINANKVIAVIQPPVAPLDSLMRPFTGNVNGGVLSWTDSTFNTITDTATNLSNYLFSLYQFNYPVDSGTWCNSDNSTYFSAYPQTTLTLHANDVVDSFNTQVFLLFSNINSMVHVYENYNATQDFPYNYAPLGLSCTAVAIGVKNGHLYSSFTPITIGNNQAYVFTLSLTTSTAFLAKLKTL